MSHQQVLPPKVNKLEGNPDVQVAIKTPGKQKAMCLILSACGGAMIMVEPNKKDTRARGNADVAPRQEGMHSAEARACSRTTPSDSPDHRQQPILHCRSAWSPQPLPTRRSATSDAPAARWTQPHAASPPQMGRLMAATPRSVAAPVESSSCLPASHGTAVCGSDSHFKDGYVVSNSPLYTGSRGNTRSSPLTSCAHRPLLSIVNSFVNYLCCSVCARAIVQLCCCTPSLC